MLLCVVLREFDVNLLRHPRLLVFPQLHNAALECIYDKPATLRCD